MIVNVPNGEVSDQDVTGVANPNPMGDIALVAVAHFPGWITMVVPEVMELTAA